MGRISCLREQSRVEKIVALISPEAVLSCWGGGQMMQSVNSCSLLSSSGFMICMILDPLAGILLLLSLGGEAPMDSLQTMMISNQRRFKVRQFLHLRKRLSIESGWAIINFNEYSSKMLDKENSLTFHNITQTMKLNRCRQSGACCFHQDKIGKYRNRQNDLLYCVSCAIQEASRGAIVEDLSKGQPSHSKHSKLSLLQDIYQQSQQQIHEYIELYNIKHQKLLQAMTDLQIRDLITFNRKIEENHALFRRMKEQLNKNWDRLSLLNMFQCHSSNIFKNLDQLQQQIIAITTSNQLKPSNSRSGLASPQTTSFRSSPKHKSKNRSQIIQPEGLNFHISNNSLRAQKNRFKQNNSRQSFTKSQPNTGSYTSKNSTTEQIKKSTLEDTPESVKVMMSQSGFRTTNAMATTMFQKIDICESINVGQAVEKSSQDSKRASLLRKNRYESNQE